MKKLEGQMDLQDWNKIYRTTCLLTGKDDCNILNLHDVAVEVGCDCQYGCCYSCKLKEECGACCNTAREEKWRKKQKK